LVAYFQTDHILRNGVCLVPREKTDKYYPVCLCFNESVSYKESLPKWMKTEKGEMVFIMTPKQIGYILTGFVVDPPHCGGALGVGQ
jgi:hypothetical protein